MTQVIQAVLTTVGRGYSSSPAFAERLDVVSIGLVVGDNQVVWGDCVPIGIVETADNSIPTHWEPADIIQAIETEIAPRLVNKPLQAVRELMQEIDGLTETVTIAKELPPEPPKEPDRRVSRRDLFRGRLAKPDVPEPETQYEYLRVTRHLNPALRYGVSQALVKAFALSENLTVAEAIGTLYDIQSEFAPVKLMAEIDRAQLSSVNSIMPYNVSAIGYTAASSHAQTVLGNDGVFMQKYVRQMKEQIENYRAARIFATAESEPPALVVNVQGGYGKLFPSNSGRQLGKLVGLEKVVKPLQLYVVDPVLHLDKQTHVRELRQLKQYGKMRKASFNIVAKQHVLNTKSLAEFIDVDMATTYYLDLPLFGSVEQIMGAIQLCKKHDVGFILGGETADTLNTASFNTHLALATAPTFLVAKPQGDIGILHSQNQMAQTLAALRHKS